MPSLAESVVQDIMVRLANFLAKRPSYSNPKLVGSGGSAATFKVDVAGGTVCAVKVYDPKFLQGDNAQAELIRLKIQSSLIGHQCPCLVQLIEIEESEGTAFVVMDFVHWPCLKDVLHKVPDEKVSQLINQLVDAVVYLEKLDLAHRDIKPENIHVSEDFNSLILLDLGVAKAVSMEDISGTDHGHKRPFIATAQYSSPEYLFRLDAPSAELWKALNIYQVGAVLHDLINKIPLFQEEVDLGNRWLVARAVLTKQPSFSDADPSRLAAQKSLALRCLTKDMKTRLRLVNWSDFTFEASVDSLSALKSRLAKGSGSIGYQAVVAAKSRLQFEKEQFGKRLSETIRNELIAACEKNIPLTLVAKPAGGSADYLYQFQLNDAIRVDSNLSFDWFGEPDEKTARVNISAALCSGGQVAAEPQYYLVAASTINESEDIVALQVAERLADILATALDLLETSKDVNVLDGTDLGKLVFP